jgi:hypothetical protein
MDRDLCNAIARRRPNEFSCFTILRKECYELSLEFQTWVIVDDSPELMVTLAAEEQPEVIMNGVVRGFPMPGCRSNPRMAHGPGDICAECRMRPEWPTYCCCSHLQGATPRHTSTWNRRGHRSRQDRQNWPSYWIHHNRDDSISFGTEEPDCFV